METVDAARRWAEEWERAWREHDSDRVAALYADGATFRTSPFREPQDPQAYSDWAFSEEDSADVRFDGPVVVSGDRAVVEWWTVARIDREELTLAGVSLLRFNGTGMVIEERGYWNEKPGWHAPFEGWGR
jgi:ketosteroid isomerase-like protein